MGLLEGVHTIVRAVAARLRGPRFGWWKLKLRHRVIVLMNPWPRRPLSIRPAQSLAAMFFKAPVPRPYTRQRPEIIGAPDWLTDCIEEQVLEGQVHAPVGGIALLENVSVSGGGVVLTADGTVVEESLLNTEREREFGIFQRDGDDAPLHIRQWLFARQRRASPHVHILLKQTFDDNYGHWLAESLPRLAQVARSFDVTRCKVIVSGDPTMRQVYLDSLRLFGFMADQIEPIGFETVHVDKLIYPLPMTCHPWVKSPKTVEFLETIPALVKKRGPEPRRVFVSRNRYRKRRLVNEAEILEICDTFGFDVVYPETMSFADQVRTFRNAELVTGNCGAALTNMAFMPRGATLLALTSEHMHDSFYWDLASLKDIRYVSLHGKATEDPSGLPYSRQMDLDFTIDPEAFALLLTELLGKTAAPPTRPVSFPAPICPASEPVPLVTWQ